MEGSTTQWIRGLDADELDMVRNPHPTRGNPNLRVVSESGFYALVLKSRKPEAQAFRKWVTSVVLPSLRKHGGSWRQPVPTLSPRPVPMRK